MILYCFLITYYTIRYTTHFAHSTLFAETCPNDDIHTRLGEDRRNQQTLRHLCGKVRTQYVGKERDYDETDCIRYEDWSPTSQRISCTGRRYQRCPYANHQQTATRWNEGTNGNSHRMSLVLYTKDAQEIHRTHIKT